MFVLQFASTVAVILKISLFPQRGFYDRDIRSIADLNNRSRFQTLLVYRMKISIIFWSDQIERLDNIQQHAFVRMQCCVNISNQFIDHYLSFCGCKHTDSFYYI